MLFIGNIFSHIQYSTNINIYPQKMYAQKIYNIMRKMQREKYCTLLMFPWHQPNFTKQGFIIIGTPGLVLGARITTWESFPVMLDKVKKHMWRILGPFLFADPCKVLHMDLLLSTVLYSIWPKHSMLVSFGHLNHDWTKLLWSGETKVPCFGQIHDWHVWYQNRDA